jgi:hypothetical protein
MNKCQWWNEQFKHFVGVIAFALITVKINCIYDKISTYIKCNVWRNLISELSKSLTLSTFLFKTETLHYTLMYTQKYTRPHIEKFNNSYHVMLLATSRIYSTKEKEILLNIHVREWVPCYRSNEIHMARSIFRSCHRSANKEMFQASLPRSQKSVIELVHLCTPCFTQSCHLCWDTSQNSDKIFLIK